MPIEIKGLTHVYWPGSTFSRRALDNLDLRIEDGEIIGILGSNGSGKSTFGLLLAGLIKPTMGRIIIDGQDIHAKGFDLRELRQKIGYLFQNPEHQMIGLRVLDEVAYGLRKLGVDEKRIMEKVAHIISQLHIDFQAIKNHPVFSLSRGQIKYTAIISLLTMSPSVLILDEPTAGLEYQGVENLLAVLKCLNKTYNVTIIIISHNVNEVLKVADRLIFLDQGSIYLDLGTTELLPNFEILDPLGIPEPDLVTIIKKLRQQGFSITSDLLTEEQLVEAIQCFLGEKSNE